MANKSMENIVHELLKTMTTLHNKVSTLECKIDDQNALLMQQSQHIKTLFEWCTLHPTTKTPTLDQAAAQRPLRSARIKAAAAISATSLTLTAKNNKIEGGKQKKLPSSYSETSAKTSERNGATKSSATMNSLSVQNTTEIMSTKPAIMSAKGSANISVENNVDEDWITVRRNTRKRTNKITIGVGKEDTELQAVENIKYIQAWSFTPNTTSEMVLKFMNKIQPCDQYYVEKRILKTDRHAAFVIGIPESMFHIFNSPTVWPQRVRFSNWFLRQPREGRGNNVTH